MANGKHGDHPLTDILVHKIPVFSPTIDALITEIAALGGEKDLRDRFNLFSPPPSDTFTTELQMLRDSLKRQARERGWEIS